MATTSDSDKIRESKGKLIDVGPEITHIADLEPTVTRQLKLSCIESGPQSTSTLANRQTTVGNPIQANMDIKDADYFHRLLHLKKAYRITGFSCEQTGPRERTLENPTSLIFRRYIDLIEIPNDGFPEPYFNFASYNELPARADVIIAILTAVNRVHTSGDATRNRVRRRTIDIQDLNGNTIVLTPWHEMALNFNVQEYEPMEKPVVIAKVQHVQAYNFWAPQLLIGI
ncbi:hypothetical protein Tco_0579600 [Tanacetum coccineum]